MLKLPTKSNGVITEKTFRPIVKQAKVKNDLVFDAEEGRFAIAPSFIKDQVVDQGWSVAFDDDTKKLYLLQTATEEKHPFAIFLKTKKEDSKTINKFKSDAANFEFAKSGYDLSVPFKLTLVTDVPDTTGFNVYEVTPATGEDLVDEETDVTDVTVLPAPSESEVPTLDIPSTPFTATTDENGTVVDVIPSESVTLDTTGTTYAPDSNEVDALAQTGVEEQPQSENVTGEDFAPSDDSLLA